MTTIVMFRRGYPPVSIFIVSIERPERTSATNDRQIRMMSTEACLLFESRRGSKTKDNRDIIAIKTFEAAYLHEKISISYIQD
jgi:hypothetical protein